MMDFCSLEESGLCLNLFLFNIVYEWFCLAYTLMKVACVWAIESLDFLRNKLELTRHIARECFLEYICSCAMLIQCKHVYHEELQSLSLYSHVFRAPMITFVCCYFSATSSSFFLTRVCKLTSNFDFKFCLRGEL